MMKRALPAAIVLLALAIIVAAFPRVSLAQDSLTSPCAVDELERDPTVLADEDSPLAGRLGSEREDFEAIYGEPLPDDLFTEYEIPECGTVLASYHDESGTLTGIDVYAPRDEDRDIWEGDPRDWTVEEAELVIASFTPIDAEEMESYTYPAPMEMVRTDFYSQSLLESVPEATFEYVDNDPDYGQYMVIMRVTDEGTISGISLKISLEDPPANE